MAHVAHQTWRGRADTGGDNQLEGEKQLGLRLMDTASKRVHAWTVGAK